MTGCIACMSPVLESGRAVRVAAAGALGASVRWCSSVAGASNPDAVFDFASRIDRVSCCQVPGGVKLVTQLLLVEDQPLVANALRRALRAAGYDLSYASSCSGAMRHAGYFPCAVMDIELGDGDGIDLAERLIERGRLGAVVFHSGCCDPLRENRARALGELVPKSGGSVERVLLALEFVIRPR